MDKNFPFYCYINGYENDPTLYHFKSKTYTYDNIHAGNYPKVCFTYLETFDFEKYHHPSFLTSGNSSIEACKCVIDETCETYVDIGANCGFTSYFAYLRGAKNIIAFEPSPKEGKAFLMNNIPNSTLYQMGISNKTGFIDLPTVWTNIKTLTYVTTLDYLFEQNVFNKIDFLKIDVEGHEFEVFEGLSDTNLSKIKNISLEIHGMSHTDNPRLGHLFKENLKKRLWSVPYFDGTSYRNRYTIDLHKSSESHFYSTLE